jgi:predicted TIM-barrel fold metal-dependent hydrolase
MALPNREDAGMRELSETTRNKILVGNAARLYRL